MTVKAKRYIKVKFLSSKDEQLVTSYHYVDGFKKPLELFEAVLVPTRYGLSLAYVVELDTAGYQGGCTLKVAERIKSKVVSDSLKSKRVKALEEQLKREVDKMDKLSVYEKYAESNPAIAEMVKALRELSE